MYQFRLKITGVFVCFSFLYLSAQNPISPPGIYIADPSAHVWNNGKLYIYGSVDETCDYYCSRRYHVMSTEDMVNWIIHKNAFSSDGENDAVPYNDNLLFAPDCAYRNDTFYLYYCQPSRKEAEGTAVSLSPGGTFIDGKKIELGGYEQIDPSVFIDDDGQAYYVWGQFTMKMARMKPNMRTLDISSIRDSILTEHQHHFHEGAYMTKRNGIYYLVFADISRAGMPTCIGYATSKKPFGPYNYGGVIIDNDQCNPGNWNNHGSIEKFDDQWYVFYHRSTHGCKKMRKACVEPITFNPDGSIPEVEMTSQGAGAPFVAQSNIRTESACILQGNVRVSKLDDDNEGLTGIATGDKAAFKYIDFVDGVKKIDIRILPKTGGTLIIAIDQPWHTRLATVKIPSEDDHESWQTITTEVNNITGVHALWLVFYGGGNDICSIDWFRFE